MKIKFLHGPKKGEIAHAPRSQEIEVLLGAGIIEEVPLSETERSEIAQNAGHTIPPYVPTPEWSVIKHNVTGEVFVQRRFLTETALFNGVHPLGNWSDLTAARAKELSVQFNAMKAKEEAQARANDRARHAR